MADYPSTSRPSTFNRYSRTSVGASNRSWVYPYNQNPPPAAPAPAPAPAPPRARAPAPQPPRPFVQRQLDRSGSRPLPNPFPRTQDDRGPFRVINTTPTPVQEEDRDGDGYFNVDPQGPSIQDRYLTEGLGKGEEAVDLRPKQKSVVRRFLKGVRRLPSSVFGYGVGMGKRGGTITSTTTMTAGTEVESGAETLPRYTSNPSSPMVGRLPIAEPGSVANKLEGPPRAKSPPPEVVRLSDSLRNRGNYRIPPPSEGGTNDEAQHEESSEAMPPDRTTYMVYDQAYDPNRASNLPNRTPIVSRLSSTPALSYVSEERASLPSSPLPDAPRPLPLHPTPPQPPLQPLRPTSFHPSVTQRSSVAESVTTTAPGPNPNGNPRLSQTSQAQALPRRITPPALIPGALRMPTPPPPVPAPHGLETPVRPPAPTLPSGDCIDDPPLSPISVEPGPADDYAKMGLSGLRSRASHSHAHSHNHSHLGDTVTNTTETGTTYSTSPSFTLERSPVERFFTLLYRMPWISHGRLTVDYLPGVGVRGFGAGGTKSIGRKGVKGMKYFSNERTAKRAKVVDGRRASRVEGWYRSVLDRSRRNSGSLDLLSSEASRRSDFGLRLDDPAMRHHHPTHSARRRGTKSHHHRHHSSSHHRHRGTHTYHNHHSKRRRQTATTLSAAITGATDDYAYDANLLMHPMYPYPYPTVTYPYPYGAMPMPFGGASIPPPALPQPPNHNHNSFPADTVASHPRQSKPNDAVPPGPLPPPGYAMYLIHPAAAAPQSTGETGGVNVPTALRPGVQAGRGGEGGKELGEEAGLHPPPAQTRNSPPIPGAFAS